MHFDSFTGSAGVAVVTEDRALLFTDCETLLLRSVFETDLISLRRTAARYYVQAAKQLGPSWELVKVGLKESKQWDDWLLDVSFYRAFGAEIRSHWTRSWSQGPLSASTRLS